MSLLLKRICPFYLRQTPISKHFLWTSTLFHNDLYVHNQRCFHRNTILHKGGIIQNFIQNTSLFEKSKIQFSGAKLYETVVDQIDYETLFQRFEMPDTFFSWYLITELHVWMLSVRAMAEETEHGRYLRNRIIESMWKDISVRIKKMQVFQSKNYLAELGEQFKAALIGYDEGLLTDDKVLAGMIWRRIFQKQCVKPVHIEALVKYIHEQVALLDQENFDKLIKHSKISWIKIEEIK